MTQKATVQQIPNEPPSDMTQMIEQGFKLIRLEGDQQRQMSIQIPRDEAGVMKALKNELSLAPRFAEKFFYRIPFKKKDGGTEWVEGLSIKAAMALQRRWGNCASAGRVVEEQADRIICEGVFMDYETNSRVMRQVAVSRFYKPANSNARVPFRPDMLEKAVASGISKAIRNAVTNALPEYLKIQLFEEAKRLAGTKTDATGKAVKKPLKERVEELFVAFEGHGFTRLEIARIAKADSVNEQVYEDLLGILNAVEDGHVTKESLLAQEPPAETGAQEEPAVKLENIVK